MNPVSIRVARLHAEAAAVEVQVRAFTRRQLHSNHITRLDDCGSAIFHARRSSRHSADSARIVSLHGVYCSCLTLRLERTMFSATVFRMY